MADRRSGNLLDAANRIILGWNDAVSTNGAVRLFASLAALCFVFGLSLQGVTLISGDVSPEQASFGRLLFYAGFPFAGLAALTAWLSRGREANDPARSQSSAAAAIDTVSPSRSAETDESIPWRSSMRVRLASLGAVLLIPLGLLMLAARDSLATPVLFIGGVLVVVAMRRRSETVSRPRR
jgi:hypothetical protein